MTKKLSKQMSTLLIIFSFFCITLESLSAEIPSSSLKVMAPMNVVYHPLSTTNAEAQRSFDQGLTYIYAFNYDLAFQYFQNAAKADSILAMAYWGMALALGQNINADVTPENELRAYSYIQTALKLSSNASPSEKDYIKALATRYSNDSKVDLISLRYLYKDAMKKLAATYSEDLDAATLYAESILDLDPWSWWGADGKPRPGTMEAIDVLDNVLRRNPQHVGANHYYIHALEKSPYPERALMSARRLETLLPESGHLLHMPCHIFFLVGDYERAVEMSKKAIAQDREYYKKYGLSIGLYPAYYLSHNLYFLTRTYMLMEDYPKAIEAAFEVVKFVEPLVKSVTDLDLNLVVPLEIYLYFHKWNEILSYSFDSDDPQAQTYLHFSRAMAYASLGDLTAAQKEKNLMIQSAKTIKNPNLFLLDATIADKQNNMTESINDLKKGLASREEFSFEEAPSWYHSCMQMLGFIYLQQGRYKEAETIFKSALNMLQRNGRSLFGLYLSLKGQDRTIDAFWVEREMNAALIHASEVIPKF